MTSNDCNAPSITFSLARCVEANEDGLILLVTKDSLRSADFSDVQILHKFAGRVTPNWILMSRYFSASNITKMEQD